MNLDYHVSGCPSNAGAGRKVQPRRLCKGRTHFIDDRARLGFFVQFGEEAQLFRRPGAANRGEQVCHRRVLAQNLLDAQRLLLGLGQRGARRQRHLHGKLVLVDGGHKAEGEQRGAVDAARKDGGGEQDRHPLMAQHHVQHAAIEAVEPGHGLALFVLCLLLVFLLLPHLGLADEVGAEHGGHRQRLKERDAHRNRHGQTKGNKEAPDDAFGVGHGQEDGHHCRRGGKHGQEDLGGADAGCLARGLAHVHPAQDVLAHHDGVVDHQADHQRQRQQRDVVEANAHQVHEEERGDHDHRQAGDGHDRAAQVAKEGKDDQRGQQRPPQQVFDGAFDRAFDQDGLVAGNGNRQVLVRLEDRLQRMLDILHHRHGVGATLLADAHHDRLDAVEARDALALFEAVLHCCHVRQEDGRAAVDKDDVADVVQRGEIAGRAQRKLLTL